MVDHKVPYYEDESFKLYVESLGGVVMLHCICSHWSSKVLRKMYSVFNTLKTDCIQLEIFQMMTVTPNPKFAKLFGGTVINKIEYHDINYEVIVWDLKLEH